MNLVKWEESRDAKDEGLKLKLALRKVSMLECIKSFLRITNNAERLDKSWNSLLSSQSLVSIKEAAKKDEKKKKDKELKKHYELGPRAA